MEFRHCTIIGLGLLGGSLALDLRRQYPALAITGIARRQATLDQAAALRCGDAPVFTQVSQHLADAREADLVVLCTPVQVLVRQLAELVPHLIEGAVITDVGSTKRQVMNAAATVMPPPLRFIGGHPMAGSDRMGLQHARHDLYRGATWALCVPPGAEAESEKLAALITALGACPLIIDADTHDAIVALTSHLPHVIAGALTNVALGSAYDDMVLPFIAGGFRDSTRIAAAGVDMWRDIFLTNRDNLVKALDAMKAEVEQWQAAIRAGDAPHVEALLTMARDRRDRLNR
jgi:prephenate dehydrogenase